MPESSEPTTKPGIPRIRASAVCVHRAHLLCVRLRDPHTHVARWFVPGGAVEPGETPAAAAERETFEETGYRVRVETGRELVLRYPFEWNDIVFDITTHFFRAELCEPDAEPAVVDDASYHEGVAWVPLSEIAEAIGFHEGMFGAVKELI